MLQEQMKEGQKKFKRGLGQERREEKRNGG